MALALAPSATNTVEKPATNSSAATTVSRLTRGGGSLSASRSSEVPARYTRYGGTSGSTHGDRKLTIPASSAAKTVTSAAMRLNAAHRAPCASRHRATPHDVKSG